MIILSAHNIHLGYQRDDGQLHSVLRDFNLQLRSGELLTLLGPSGVGKSSLLRVLAGLQTPQMGDVFLFEQAIKQVHPRMSFVFQNPTLLPWLNVYDNIGFGLNFAHQAKISPHTIRQRIQAALKDVGLSDAQALYPKSLSGGMAQRVALARALVRQPQVIFLDEPFSALDEITREQMQDLLRDLVAKHHTAAVLITHDIDEALWVSERIILLGKKPGRQMGEWSIKQSAPRHQALLNLQNTRLQIVQTMQSAIQQECQKTVDYSI